jgi:hypothetical protein
MYKRTTEYEFCDDDNINPINYPMLLKFDIYYTLISGCPARIHYDENDHPEEPTEFEIYDCRLLEINGIKVDKSENNNALNKWFLVYVNSKNSESLFNRIFEQASEEISDYNLPNED